MTYRVENLTLLQLQNECRKRGLSSVGTKSVLAKRLAIKFGSHSSPAPRSSRTENLMTLTLLQLQNEYRKRGLSSVGTKSVLAKRLAIKFGSHSSPAPRSSVTSRTENLMTLTLLQLQNECKKRGLSSVGPKAVLAKRLAIKFGTL